MTLHQPIRRLAGPDGTLRNGDSSLPHTKMFSNREKIFTAVAKLAYYKRMEPKNTVLDDICADIGYTATTVLVAWYGGTVLYIPRVASCDHPLSKLLGMPAFVRLVQAFEGSDRDVFIPKNGISLRYERWRDICKFSRAGDTVDVIAEKTGLSTRQVTNVIDALVEHGLLPPECKNAD